MTNAAIKLQRLRARNQRWQKARREHFYSLGLNWRGQPRKYAVHPELAHLPATQRATALHRKAKHALIAAGLTWRGTIRKQHRRPELAGLQGVERRKARCRLRTRERRAAGFNAHGQPLKRPFNGPGIHLHARTIKQISWDYLRRSMNIQTADVLTPTERNAA